MTPKDFIGTDVIYDNECQKIFGRDGSELQMIADLRGWGSIQNLFKNRDGSIRMDEAARFQDELGDFICEAINEKLQKTITNG